MQKTPLKLADSQIFKYFLFIHPVIASIGMISLVLSLLLMWTIFIPFMLKPFINLPFSPYEFVVILCTGALFFIWLIISVISSNSSLSQYRDMEISIHEKSKRTKRKNNLLLICFLVLIFYSTFQNLIERLFPNIFFLFNLFFMEFCS
jgi:hypothetical protein